MRELPALFRTEMVRAILEDRKWKTRRVIKPQPTFRNYGAYLHKDSVWYWQLFDMQTEADICIGKSPWQPGDHLWVRETWRVGAWNGEERNICVDYKTDGYCRREWLDVPDCELFEKLWEESTCDAEEVYGQQEIYKWKPGESPCRWRSSMFMYKWITRLWLEVLDVKVERLQDISGQDAVAEGFGQGLHEADLIHFGGYKKAKEEFRDYWDTIYKKKPEFQWKANPWVWVYEFKRINQSQP